jgi:hypothetical protein
MESVSDLGSKQSSNRGFGGGGAEMESITNIHKRLTKCLWRHSSEYKHCQPLGKVIGIVRTGTGHCV